MICGPLVRGPTSILCLLLAFNACQPKFGLLCLAAHALHLVAQPGNFCAGVAELLWAVAMLPVLQEEGTRRLPAGHPAGASALDQERFLFELKFFREHYIEGLRGLRLGGNESRALDLFLASLATAAAAPPRVLCHRDFHSRNLLVQNGRLRLVDFQDARLGPPAYDLVSLLRDSYAVLPERFRERLFLAFVEMRRDSLPDTARFRRDFDVVALQRNLKAIGTFAYQAVVRKKDHYLPYIPPTWDYVFETLQKLPEWASVAPLLTAAARR